MKPKSSIYLLLISIVFAYSFQLDVYASSSFGDIETQITPESNEQKIIALQNLFKDLGLYDGEIDGKYKSIEKAIIDYQIKAGIIKDSSDWGAGYFGKKTILALKKDYQEKFDESSNKHIKLEEPSLGERTFIVTAYYSPLPGQRNYITGSYEGDIRLNGDGGTTASGKGVFSGLIAAPKNYNFGTKIELEGIGVGSVEDRGGSIVNAGDKGHEFDRIDVWMGYGDDGLERALKWGKREIKGKIIEPNSKITMQFDESPITKYANLTVDAENPKNENVISLQTLFKELGLYKGEIDGKFENIKNILIEFQISNGIIDSINSNEAGYFGEKTLAVLRKKYGSGIFKKPEKNYELSLAKKKEIEKIKNELLKFINKKSNQNKEIENKFIQKIKNNIDNFIKNSKDEKTIKELQYLKDIL